MIHTSIIANFKHLNARGKAWWRIDGQFLDLAGFYGKGKGQVRARESPV